MKIIRYPDGSSYVKLEEPISKKITFRLNTYEDLWHLNQIVDVYNYNNIVPTIIIPNLIDTQADRRFNSNESSGLKLVCKFLNNLNANFEIFHPHNPEAVEALMDNVKIIDNKEFIKEVFNKIYIENNTKDKNFINSLHPNFTLSGFDLAFREDNLHLSNNLILTSSDAGGFKPLMKLCDKINWQGETFSASKSRKYENGETKLIQQVNREDFGGKDILIIDDICVYGGTFKGLAKLLKERNCGKLYLAVSHMTIEDHPQDSVFEYFDKVFCTNSKYDSYTAENEHREMLIPKNLEIIKLF
jgi:ribose-phosphate pyrophosphokinase